MEMALRLNNNSKVLSIVQHGLPATNGAKIGATRYNNQGVWTPGQPTPCFYYFSDNISIHCRLNRFLFYQPASSIDSRRQLGQTFLYPRRVHVYIQDFFGELRFRHTKK